MKVHFLRHAQSIFNANLTSDKDCDLTEKGIQQASDISGHYDIVICSTMKRACKTLDYSNLTYSRLIFTDLCREKKQDICDFLPYEDETKKETEEELQLRIRSFLYFLKSQVSKYQGILVVSHGDFIHTIGKKQQPYPKNAEIQVHEV
jgi:broad specificity phosphatase PhoE